MVAVAQLVRVLDCDSRGRGFETHRLPQNGARVGYWLAVSVCETEDL